MVPQHPRARRRPARALARGPRASPRPRRRLRPGRQRRLAGALRDGRGRRPLRRRAGARANPTAGDPAGARRPPCPADRERGRRRGHGHHRALHGRRRRGSDASSSPACSLPAGCWSWWSPRSRRCAAPTTPPCTGDGATGAPTSRARRAGRPGGTAHDVRLLVPGAAGGRPRRSRSRAHGRRTTGPRPTSSGDRSTACSRRWPEPSAACSPTSTSPPAPRRSWWRPLPGG